LKRLEAEYNMVCDGGVLVVGVCQSWCDIAHA
jgi:hypothetical protein